MQPIADKLDELITALKRMWPASPAWQRGVPAVICNSISILYANQMGEAPIYFKTSSRVHLVVAGDFGERIRELPANELVWVAETPINSPVVRAIWGERPVEPGEIEIGLFPVRMEQTPEEWALGAIPGIDVSYNEEGAGPGAYSVLRVIGTPLSPTLRASLETFGFYQYKETTDGFTAQKHLPWLSLRQEPAART